MLEGVWRPEMLDRPAHEQLAWTRTSIARLLPMDQTQLLKEDELLGAVILHLNHVYSHSIRMRIDTMEQERAAAKPDDECRTGPVLNYHTTTVCRIRF